MLQKIFESLDENVFTAELKESLEVQFNEAVTARSMVMADEIVENKIEELNEKSEQHIEYLDEKFNEAVETVKSDMIDSVDRYLDRVVEKFMAQRQEDMVEHVKVEQLDMLVEGFQSLLVNAGVDMKRIVDANSEIVSESSEEHQSYDEVVNENIDLQRQLNEMKQQAIVKEMSEDMTIMERQKFARLAEMVDFVNESSFTRKLETIKESMKGSPSKLEESKEESTKVESPSWAHLI